MLVECFMTISPEVEFHRYSRVYMLNTFVVEGLKRRPRGAGERRAGCDVVYSWRFAFSYTRAHTATLATLHYAHGLTDWHMTDACWQVCTGLTKILYTILELAKRRPGFKFERWLFGLSVTCRAVQCELRLALILVAPPQTRTGRHKCSQMGLAELDDATSVTSLTYFYVIIRGGQTSNFIVESVSKIIWLIHNHSNQSFELKHHI